MKIKTLLGASAISAAAALCAASTSYADIQYVVNGTFDDGGTVTGWFDLNVYGLLDGFDLTTMGGSLTGYEYTPSTTYAGGGGAGDYVVFNRASPYAYDGALQFGFSAPLAGYNAQPILTGEDGPSWESSNFASADGTPNAPVRYLEAGSTVTGVPELSTWAMMAAGFAGLGLAGHRRAKKDAFAIA